MNLEQEIKQKAFRSEQSKLIVNLIYTYNQLKSRIATVLKNEGITMQQYNVLRIVNGSGEEGITTSEIRERMLDKMSDASRMVDRLEAMQLVVKRRDRDDRRVIHVFLTEKGQRLVFRLMEQETIDQLANGVKEESAQQLNKLLDAFRASL
ncbi:MAG TPA: MarR family transcriptional regulator [Cryomorphaceae bacterium]|jgi:DNA-binding MarR family transcriptional regulator|nr:MarR family winged helix-turn-helix transcriptional regulator [Schleiferiaceae bacterium]MDG1055603.1 MarR family winged helix-turn-helix transcriptional regulator [Schleiferiaceae bacterium]MDG2110848.1 MarR family winged helix-turn-helix transcriptional regulator [Schleiferiaceae bacterium]CAI8402774.1 MAG: putative HTH-type transcriptional regulator YusO [Flavobacteriales bacterium UBA4585]HBK20101.1 MarR family transcriptional regulator [Cryomorphaceae bacterium]|tara:strand:- start:401 stop:853 length:453 start_codon:yes stop_codon:yes gene_type:complete